MSASLIESQFKADLAARHAEIVGMERERIALALPAHSGDEAAMLRLIDLRADVEAKRAGLRDLEQAIVDIGPAVQVERASERYRRRARVHDSYQSASVDAINAMEAVDAAILQLASAFRAAAAPLDRVRGLALELMAPVEGPNIGHQVEQRMMIAQRIGIRSTRELVETALEDVHVLYREMAPFPPRSETKLTQQMAQSLRLVEARIQDAMSDDRKAAAAAGVVLELEPA